MANTGYALDVPSNDDPALGRGVLIYMAVVLLVVVGILLLVGLAAGFPEPVVVAVAGVAGLVYVVGIGAWVKKHVQT